MKKYDWRYVWHGSRPEQGSNVVIHTGDRLHMGTPSEVETLIASHNDLVVELQHQLAEAHALIADLNRFDLPNVARFAIESYLEENK